MPETAPRKLSHYFTHSKRKGMAGLPLASVTMNDGLILRDDMDRKMDTNLSDEQHALVEPGDIAYNMMRMWQGAFGLATAPVNVSPAYVVMRAKPTLDPRFAAQWLKSDRALYLLWAYSYGLTDDRLRLYPKEFLQIPVEWPAITEQRRIAAVLDAWDEAIFMAEKLVGAKVRLGIAIMQRLVGDCHNPFQVHGQPLGELASVEYGKAVAETDYDQNGSSWILGTQGKIGVSNQSDFTGEAVVVGRKGTLNNPIYVPVGQPFRSIDTTFVLKPRARCKALFFYLRHINLAKLNEASGVPSVSGDTLKSLPIPDLPDLLEGMMSGVEKRVNELKCHAALLRKQKRSLMQKLLTAQLRVPESIETLMPEASS